MSQIILTISEENKQKLLKIINLFGGYETSPDGGIKIDDFVESVFETLISPELKGIMPMIGALAGITLPFDEVENIIKGNNKVKENKSLKDLFYEAIQNEDYELASELKTKLENNE